jgi:hypothetical protein
MSRPKGSKDSKKRRTRNQYGFSKQDIDTINKLKNQHKTNKDIERVTGFSKSQINKICKENNIKQIDNKIISEKEELILDESKEEICGIYIIQLFRKDGYQGYYIGSSTNIRKRCVSHQRLLQINNHYNARLQEDFNNKKSIKYKIWSIEPESDLLKIENNLISQYAGLYNTWSAVNAGDIKEYIDLAIEKINARYTVDVNDGCWLYKYKRKDGYGRDIGINIDGRKKYLKPHRVSYYAHYQDYPELIRHKCNNKLCINPEHLEPGSYRDNGLDKTLSKWQEFKDKWKEYNGDYTRITEYFGYKKNYKSSSGQEYYCHIKAIAKKLGLV